jgi:formylglycine-generating enzyme required for sulfatase activity
MIVLPAGEFLMGSPESDSEAFSDEKPLHRVQIGYRLAVGRNPVTFEEWDAYVADDGAERYPDDQGWGRGRRPVINVSWNDAKQYVAWLSRKTGRVYRLLSEAEWEYVARAGTTTSRWWGNDITLPNANYDYTNAKTTEVGSYPENPFKLYDILGNVWEWVEDCWNRDYHGAPEDGAVWITEDRGQRVLRGGAWDSSPKFVRSAYRNKNSADVRNNYFGLRVARTFPETGHRPARGKQAGRRQR